MSAGIPRGSQNQKVQGRHRSLLARPTGRWPGVWRRQAQATPTAQRGGIHSSGRPDTARRGHAHGDPHETSFETSPDILKLRELHAAMDRAVLEAYGWHDLAERATCEFLLDYDEDELSVVRCQLRQATHLASPGSIPGWSIKKAQRRFAGPSAKAGYSLVKDTFYGPTRQL
ncbi:MAG: hypothetical protein NTY19_21720 [Planctomycetota bacterium]|nr:hypothetical protein [Planctomycetota bacterium]